VQTALAPKLRSSWANSRIQFQNSDLASWSLGVDNGNSLWWSAGPVRFACSVGESLETFKKILTTSHDHKTFSFLNLNSKPNPTQAIDTLTLLLPTKSCTDSCRCLDDKQVGEPPRETIPRTKLREKVRNSRWKGHGGCKQSHFREMKAVVAPAVHRNRILLEWISSFGLWADLWWMWVCKLKWCILYNNCNLCTSF